MARVKGGTIHRARRAKVMKLAKGYFDSSSVSFFHSGTKSNISRGIPS